jgi:membrane-associated protease RseP (regulator of RpoE activity)
MSKAKRIIILLCIVAAMMAIGYLLDMADETNIIDRIAAARSPEDTGDDEGVDRSESNSISEQRRPMIGIYASSMDENVAAEVLMLLLRQGIDPDYFEDNIPKQGAIITGLGANTEAEQAGLMVYDIIIAVDGVPIASREELIEITSAMSAGDRIVLSIMRNGHELLDITTTLFYWR